MLFNILQCFANFCTAHICGNVSRPELSSSGPTPDPRRGGQNATLSGRGHAIGGDITLEKQQAANVEM